MNGDKLRDLAYQHSTLRLASLLQDPVLYDLLKRGFMWTNALFNTSNPRTFAETEISRSLQVRDHSIDWPGHDI
jgi:hypothetical protein